MVSQARLEGKSAERVIDVDADDISGIEDELDEDLSSIFAEFGGGPKDDSFTIRVHRVVEGKGEFAYLFDCIPSELPILDKLRDEYGGGLFEMRVYQIVGGKKQLRKRPKVRVEAPPKNKQAAPQQTDLVAILAAMKDQQQIMFEQLTAVIKQGSGTPDLPGNPLTLLRDLAGVMRDIMPAPAPGTSFKDMVETMAAMRELLPEARGGGETNWLDVMTKALESPLLGNILEGAANAAKQGKPAQLSAPQPQPQPQPGPGSEQVQQPQSEEEMKALIIRQYIGNLITRAEKNQDPAFVAEMILNDAQLYNIPVEVIKTEMLSKEALDKLAEQYPKITTLRPWFDSVQAQVTELLNA